MPDDAEFWDFYWESRLLPLENLGKRQAILAASRLIRNWRNTHSNPMRVMELGCGEAQVVGALLDAHADLCNTRQAAGVDYNPASLAQCRRNYPTLKFLEGDITDADFMAGLGQYDLVLLVNALHEVFSSVISPELGEVDVPAAKAQVETALTGAVQRLAPGGWLLLFDGLEPPGDLHTEIAIRFADAAVFSDFEMFARQYQPFKIAYRRRGALGVVLSRRDFTRYLTKSIFLRKPLWQKEQKESYQYFTEEEFCTAISRQGLHIVELQTLTVDGEKWRSLVEIETPGEDFPQEHILILAQLSG
jgi:SAM-dependent methyltransferase